jgi:hypothetical protein
MSLNQYSNQTLSSALHGQDHPESGFPSHHLGVRRHSAEPPAQPGPGRPELVRLLFGVDPDFYLPAKTDLTLGAGRYLRRLRTAVIHN